MMEASDSVSEHQGTCWIKRNEDGEVHLVVKEHLTNFEPENAYLSPDGEIFIVGVGRNDVNPDKIFLNPRNVKLRILRGHDEEIFHEKQVLLVQEGTQDNKVMRFIHFEGGFTLVLHGEDAARLNHSEDIIEPGETGRPIKQKVVSIPLIKCVIERGEQEAREDKVGEVVQGTGKDVQGAAE